MGHTDPAALLEQMKKDHDGVLPKFDGEGHPLCPICETPCVAAGLTWSCPTHTEMCFALIDTLVSNETVEMAVNAADSARFTAHPNGVVVRCNTPEEGGGFSAWIGTESAPEIHGVGTGDTEAAAVLSLAGLLADFVRGHGDRIVELEAALQAERDMVGEKLP